MTSNSINIRFIIKNDTGDDVETDGEVIQRVFTKNDATA